MKHRGFRFSILFVLALSALAALIPGSQAHADGKMFVRENVPPDIPYQRALIMFKDNQQTLVLQSKYDLLDNKQATAVGWVVPVPAVPQVASMPADAADSLFWQLSMYARPKVTTIFDPAQVICALFALVLTAPLWLWLIPPVRRRIPGLGNLRATRLQVAIVLVVIGLVFVLYLPALAKSTGRSRGVEVLSEQTAGIYNVKVVAAQKADALIEWLNENKFKFGPADTACMENYIVQGWCFAVAVIDPAIVIDTRKVVDNGLAAPLILQFPCAAPTYPVALTATAGTDTEILIYLITDCKMECPGRMTLRFAGQADTDASGMLERLGMEPLLTLPEWSTQQPFLCKFKDKLTSAQMAQDIVFTPAADQAPYREHIVNWWGR